MSLIKRHKTRKVAIGTVEVGGDSPVSIQSMTKTPTTDVEATAAQIGKLAAAGCEIVRVAVPTGRSAAALPQILKCSPIPVVADIHFTGKLALAAIEAGVQGLRINPGNMHNRKSLARVAAAAKEAQIPIRIGVNSGSIAGGKKIEGDLAELMVRTALETARFLEEQDFHDIIISAKASGVRSTVKAYRMLARQTDYPLHLGITAAGPASSAVVRSAIGIGSLLLEGIGDTIRVSVTGDPVQEVEVAREILDSLELRRFGLRVISCPTCARCKVDLVELVEKVKKRLAGIDKPVIVAIMGCVVNGPGEAREADIGAACTRSGAWIFTRGAKIRKVSFAEVPEELLKELKEQ